MSLDRGQLAKLLADPNPHEMSRRADELRRQRFDQSTTFAAVEHLDVGSGRAFCPICGEEPGPSGFSSSASGLRAARTDLHVLMRPGASLEGVLAAWRALPAMDLPKRTVQLGTAGDFVSGDDLSLLPRLREERLSSVSDGLWPAFHPALGNEPAHRWRSFWRAAAKAGLQGHTVVLYGPRYDDESLLYQIEAIAELQRETQVFQSVAPVIHPGNTFGGVQDSLLTHGSLDLRVLAACRLGLAEIPHVRILYNRSDLKLAHLSLASGADDLEGHLAFEARDRSADADAKDLSLREMPQWLREVGFVPVLRNGLMQPVTVAAKEGK